MRIGDALRERFIIWALRVRPPEPAPIVLTQRRVYVLPTRFGLAFATSLAIMLVGAINYNLSLGYVLVFLLSGLGVAAILNAFRNLAGLAISPGRCEPVFAGEPARFVIHIANLQVRPRYAIDINLAGSPAQRIDVPAAGAAAPALSLTTTQRGWLALPRLALATTYPLGLVRAWSYCAPDRRCLVYPAPAANAPPLPTASGGREGGVRGGRGREDFAGLRAHQPADPPRHIAWKAVARQAGPLLTKQFAGEAAQRLVLDWEDLAAVADPERRIAILARWVCMAREQGLAWGLRLPGVELPPAADEAQFHACLQALALHGR